MNDIMLGKDKEIMFLLQPLPANKYKALERSILNDGCKEPIYVWHGVIVDGHKRYDICKKYERTFFIRQSMCINRAEVYAMICSQQLQRDDITNEMRKYLIGRLYAAKLDMQESTYLRNNEDDKEHSLSYVPNRAYRKQEISQEIATDLHIARGTVLKYEIYTKCIESIRSKEPEIVNKILAGDLKISHENIIELERLPAKDLKALTENLAESRIDHILYSDIRHELQWKSIRSPSQKKNEESVDMPIKHMPKYDPDAALSSLIFTIPTWAGSLDRSREDTDFARATDTAKGKVMYQLAILKQSINEMETSIKEATNNGEFANLRTPGVIRTDTNKEPSIESGISKEPIEEACPEGSSPFRYIPGEPGESES